MPHPYRRQPLRIISDTQTTRTLKAKIERARAQLGLNESHYRHLLYHITGKDSCELMPSAQLVKVIDEFKRLGFVEAAEADANACPKANGGACRACCQQPARPLSTHLPKQGSQ